MSGESGVSRLRFRRNHVIIHLHRVVSSFSANRSDIRFETAGLVSVTGFYLSIYHVCTSFNVVSVAAFGSL